MVIDDIHCCKCQDNFMFYLPTDKDSGQEDATIVSLDTIGSSSLAGVIIRVRHDRIIKEDEDKVFQVKDISGVMAIDGQFLNTTNEVRFRRRGIIPGDKALNFSEASDASVEISRIRSSLEVKFRNDISQTRVLQFIDSQDRFLLMPSEILNPKIISIVSNSGWLREVVKNGSSDLISSINETLNNLFLINKESNQQGISFSDVLFPISQSSKAHNEPDIINDLKSGGDSIISEFLSRTDYLSDTDWISYRNKCLCVAVENKNISVCSNHFSFLFNCYHITHSSYYLGRLSNA
jgi:hypothetical protein